MRESAYFEIPLELGKIEGKGASGAFPARWELTFKNPYRRDFPTIVVVKDSLDGWELGKYYYLNYEIYPATGLAVLD